jgi:DNA-binding MltR family transcriptional regulator
MPTKKNPYNNAAHWDDVLQSEVAKETDRAAVILTASLFDNALTQLLRITLVVSPSSSDELLDGANAPLGTFSAKINICYRIGLISKKMARDLHLIRSIRNQFAHNVSGCSFNESGVRDRILEIAKSSGSIERDRETRKGFPDGVRGDFIYCASWMLFSINLDIEDAKHMDEAIEEFGYHINEPSSHRKVNKSSGKRDTAKKNDQELNKVSNIPSIVYRLPSPTN